MILVYRVLATLLYPFLFIFIYCRKILGKEDPKRYKEKIFISHFNVIRNSEIKLIWFHAASIGEFKSIIPIIEQLNNNQKLNFLITTNTLSSGNLAKLELKRFNNVEHRYFPYDVPFLIDKFLTMWKPNKIFFVDSEIWPNLILKAKKYQIPIALLNARITFKTFKRWMTFPKVAKQIFGSFNMCLCSNHETKEYFKKNLSLDNIFFEGNIKLINDINEQKIKNLNSDILLKKNFWLAASTHKGEDIFCLKTHLELKKKIRNLRTIIAPRHVDRSNEIKLLSEKLNLSTQVLNKNKHILEDKEIIIINYFGALNSYFKYVKSVFIGKSMIEKLKHDGGQNPIEAAKLNCKIYHGPYVYNFDDIYKILQKNGISKQINNYNELSYNLIEDFNNYKKQNDKISDSINILGQKTFTNTMRLINNFIRDDA